MKADISLSCPVSIEQIHEMYEIYDDHNFAFPVSSVVNVKEVSGTDKCVISLNKPDDSTLRIEAVADPRMRGGAGEATCNLFLCVAFVFLQDIGRQTYRNLDGIVEEHMCCQRVKGCKHHRRRR